MLGDRPVLMFDGTSRSKRPSIRKGTAWIRGFPCGSRAAEGRAVLVSIP